MTTCEYCDRPAVCDCNRCDDRDCNAGCIQCRPIEEWDVLSRTVNQHKLASVLVIVAYAAYVYVMALR